MSVHSIADEKEKNDEKENENDEKKENDERSEQTNTAALYSSSFIPPSPLITVLTTLLLVFIISW